MTNAIRSPENDSETVVLRRTLQQMRREAEQEVQRLNEQIAERAQQTNSAVASVTAQLAMQQEMTILNQALEVKEQALEHITDECRRLEDALEDQNVALDGLQQEIERKELALTAARTEMERMRKQLAAREPSAVAVQFAALQHSPLWQRLPVWIGGALLLITLGISAFVWRAQLANGWREGYAALQRAPTPAPAPIPSPAPLVSETTANTPAPAESENAPPSAPTAQAVTQDRLRSGGLAPALARLSGGTLRMGVNRLSGEDFSPAHSVDIAPFLIGTHEVTYQEYDRFAQATGRALPDDVGWGRGNHPVVGVQWQDAVAYTEWLTRETGRRYRLPSEAEWEFAAHGGTSGSFWWGFALEPGRAACFDCGSRWDNRSPAPVGSFAANAFGLFDTAGNVMEWVMDCYHSNYQDAPADGRAWVSGNCTERVARGGAFNKPSASMRVYVRAAFSPETRLNYLGFRVARSQ